MVPEIRYRKFCDQCWWIALKAKRGYPRKRDQNHGEIVDAFEKYGCDVLDLSDAGRGIPDLLVKLRDNTIVLVEIKNPKARGKLNPLQKAFHARWTGVTFVVYTVEDVAALSNQRRAS